MPVFQANDPRATIFPGGGLLDALATSGIGQFIAEGLQQRWAEQTRRRERGEDIARGIIDKFNSLDPEQQGAFRSSIGQMSDAAIQAFTGGAFKTSTQLESALPVRPTTEGETLKRRGEKAVVGKAEADVQKAQAEADIATAQAEGIEVDLLNERRLKMSRYTGETDTKVLDSMLRGDVDPGRILAIGALEAETEAMKAGYPSVAAWRSDLARRLALQDDLTYAEIEQRTADAEKSRALIQPTIDAMRAESAQRQADATQNATVFQAEMATRAAAMQWVTGGVDPTTNQPILPLLERLRTKQHPPGDPFAGVETPEDITDAISRALFMLPETPNKQAIANDLVSMVARELRPYFASLGEPPPPATGGAYPGQGGPFAPGVPPFVQDLLDWATTPGGKKPAAIGPQTPEEVFQENMRKRGIRTD